MKLTNDIRCLILVAIVAFGVFANSLGGDFVYDDNRQILRNTLIQNPANFGTALTSDVWAFKGDGTLAASNYYRPVFTGLSILLWQLFGASPFGWHLVSVLLHAAASMLAFALLRKWETPLLPALLAALIFAVHPVHVESVAWIAGSPDLLAAIGLLSALLLTERFAADGSAAVLAGAVAAYLFALGAKEPAIVFFPVFALVFIKHGDSPRRAAAKTTPFAIAAVGFFVARWLVVGAIARPVEDPPTFVAALMSAPGVFAFYLKQIVFPATFSVNYPLRPVDSFSVALFLGPLLVAVAVLIAVAALVRGRRRLWIPAAIFFVALLPAFNLTAFPSDQIVHDRYLYLPLFGFAAAAAIALESVAFFSARAAKAIVIVAFFSTALLGWRTVVQNSVWRNDLTLWSHAAGVDPNSSSTLGFYASALSAAGRTAAAADVFSRAAEISPTPGALLGRGRNLLALGRVAEAEADLRAVISTPNERANSFALYQAYEALSLLLTGDKRFDEALATLGEARRRLPIYAAALTEKIAVVLYQKGDKENALRELEAARDQARRELLPESKDVFLRIGMLQAEFGRSDAARAALTEYIALTEPIGEPAVRENRRQALALLRTLK